MKTNQITAFKEWTQVALAGDEVMLNLQDEHEMFSLDGQHGFIMLSDLLSQRFIVRVRGTGVHVRFDSAEAVIAAGWLSENGWRAWLDGFPDGFDVPDE